MHLVQRSCQIFGTVLMGDVPVSSVVPEKLDLRLQCITHTLLCHNILLTPVHNANKA